MLVYLDEIPDLAYNHLAGWKPEQIAVGHIETDKYLKPSNVPFRWDFPDDNFVDPDSLIEDGAIYFLSMVEFSDMEDLAVGIYWDFASLSYDFKYTALVGNYCNKFTMFFSGADFALLVFKFDSKASAMLAKLSITEPRIIDDATYRGLLGKTGQSSFDLPL